MVNSRFIGSAFILAAVTCIFAVPIQQLHDETMGLNEGMYASPELAEALARSYAALEWEHSNGNSIDAAIQKRNLDQIGGGNLLRSLHGPNVPQRVRSLDPINNYLLRSYQQQNQE
ncbi:hypothetical protein KQX54_011071 [Cotesia glomerata]|uniref:Uncharacterized protein n=2 Tax=Cotesia glomerata TaxID=32391 RepID=A0AAV7J3Y2_COTGL|nr:hypothetical protein KQX54_011071 [Cotesia glomerata]